jgi:hypothetical protein
MYKKIPTPCQGESSFSPTRSPIRGEKKKGQILNRCLHLSPGFREIQEGARKIGKKKETEFIVAPQSPDPILSP